MDWLDALRPWFEQAASPAGFLSPDWLAVLRPWFEHGSYYVVFAVLVLSGVGLPVPEEITFILAGWVVGELYPDEFCRNIGGHVVCLHVHLWLMVLVGLAGILAGDAIIYFLGHHYGLRLLRRWPFRKFISDARIAKARQVFDEHGSKAVFFAGFLAGVRAPTYFLSGAMGVPYLRFVLWDAARAVLTCPVSIWLGFIFGQAAPEMMKEYKPWLFALLGLAALGCLVHWLVARRRVVADLTPPPTAAPRTEETHGERDPKGTDPAPPSGAS